MPKCCSIRKLFMISLIVVLTFNLILLQNSSLIFDNLEPIKQQLSLDKKSNREPKKCSRYPTESDMIRDNEVWQVLKMPTGSVKLLNAYLDKRMNQTIVRVNVNAVELNIIRDTIYCQFWFDENETPFVTRAQAFTYMWGDGWDTCKNCKVPYLIACPIDFDGEGPTSVSLTANPCDDASNNLKIINNQPFDGVKKKFGVCTKQLVLEDRGHGVKIIEWVHMLRLLGAHKVHMQIRNIHPDLVEVLNHLQAKELIEWKHYKDPTEIADTKLRTRQHRLLQMNVMNDCFYKVKDLYEFITIFDPDEVIMPVMEEDRTWQDIVKRLDELQLKSDAFAVSNIYYPHKKLKPYKDIPEHNYMLQHVERSVRNLKKGEGMKSFFYPDRVLVVHNHFAMRCLKSKTNWCNNKSVSPNISQLNHYRDDVQPMFKVTVLDTKIWKYKDELIKVVRETLDEIGFNP